MGFSATSASQIASAFWLLARPPWKSPLNTKPGAAEIDVRDHEAGSKLLIARVGLDERAGGGSGAWRRVIGDGEDEVRQYVLGTSTKRIACPSPATSGASRGFGARCEPESGGRQLRAPLRNVTAASDGHDRIPRAAGRRGQRRREDAAVGDSSPPKLAPDAVLVWKGAPAARSSFQISYETGALADLRKRSLWLIGGGVALLCYGLYEGHQALVTELP